MRSVKIEGRPGESVMIYADVKEVVLQVRRIVHGSDDPVAASFKSGVVLDRLQAARVAVELLQAAGAIRGDL